MNSSDVNSILCNLELTAVLRSSEVKLASLLGRLPLCRLQAYNRLLPGKRILFVNEASPSRLVIVRQKKLMYSNEYFAEFITFLRIWEVRKFLDFGRGNWLVPSSYGERYAKVISPEDELIQLPQRKKYSLVTRKEGKVKSVSCFSKEGEATEAELMTSIQGNR